MNAKTVGAAAETRLNDLQADVEAGSRLIDQIHHRAARLRDALTPEHGKKVAAVMKQVAALKACVMQQRKTLRELRHDIRSLRDLTRD